MKDHLAMAAVALLFLTATSAQAACTRDDISYYLSEGFTPEQITAICTAAPEAGSASSPEAETSPVPAAPEAETSPAPAATETEAAPPAATPEPEADIAAVPPAGNDTEEAERYLREAIKGQDIHIEAGFLHYTAKTCIPYGRSTTNKEPWEEEACALVRYKVALRGMEAKREWISQKLFQPRQIYLEGQIEREFVGNLDKFGSANRRQIMQNLQQEVKAYVPIRENMSLDRLLETLNGLAT